MSIIIDGKEYYGIIYKIENMITHEIYIGQTTHTKGFNGRYYFSGQGIERVYKYLKGNQNRNQSHNQHLRRSIEKYGFDVFQIDEVLDVALTFDELNAKEAYYIKKFDSYKNGYNMSYGGDSMPNMERPKGKDCPNSKRVCQISLDGEIIKIWDCTTDVWRELGIVQASISEVCCGKNQTAGGFIWIHEKEYSEDIVAQRVYQAKHKNKGEKPILLLSDNNDIVQEFYSVIATSKALGISKQYVSRLCLHQTTNPRFNLKFKSEYLEEQRLSGMDLMQVS